MEQLLEKNERLEKRDRQTSAAATLGITVILLFFSMFWVAFQGTVPPIEEPQWETVGYIADFGNNVAGKKDINNFEKPSETPADKPKTEPTPEPKETPQETNVSPPAPKNNHSETKSEHTVQESTTETKNNTSTENTTKPKETTNNNSKPKETSNNNSKPKTESGGSDHGNSNQTGNQGNPKAQTLNKDGMYEFGNGIGGPGGRIPLDISKPRYNIQKEAKITFTFVIRPDGSVSAVKPEFTTHTDLAAIGAAAIRKWRFSEVERGRGNLKTTVTITFRLE